MRPLGALLDQPAEVLARYLALVYLARADAARDRALNREDDAALRRFRVALRRLRTVLRAYRPELEGTVRGRDLRRLRHLARATGAVRDRQAQAAWLRRQEVEWSPAEQAARAWLLDRLGAERPGSGAGHALEKEFPEARKRLQRRLSRYQAVLDPDQPPLVRSGREALAGAVEGAAGRLRARLDAVRSAADREEAHRARLAGKRLRYLLDPFRDQLPEGEELLERLRALQDLLGDLRDGELLLESITGLLEEVPEEEAVARAGLLALMERLRVRRDRIHGQVEREWRGEAADRFVARVRAAARELAGPGADAVEIERKYLLREMPPLPHGVRPLEIQQGYLPGERLQERVRRTRDEVGERWHRTVKLGRGVRRTELEEEASPEVGEALWALTQGRRVRKQRFRVPAGELTWEIDRFLDRDLVLAEVELPAVDTPVELPDWLAPVVVREVTGESEYVNVNLAR